MVFDGGGVVMAVHEVGGVDGFDGDEEVQREEGGGISTQGPPVAVSMGLEG